ncbi:hypothetical protein KQX54_014022 [Cotesia glomerata]|uniref:PDZ domain-containing protein n=1 Tax=Cotesia glomerata TaxID=32391 RepID=A0AAV7J4Z0_COTGL|nr:hypothetical protein KQX54_014022 [Cotesia glomerata]
MCEVIPQRSKEAPKNNSLMSKSRLLLSSSSQLKLDPTNSHETVIIIRSLVPGGVAETNGQLIPGDRILFVNNVVLTNATLSEAVEVLKQAPKGKVQLGVAKPSRVLKRYLYVSTAEMTSNTVDCTTRSSVENRKCVHDKNINNELLAPLIYVTVFNNDINDENLVKSNTI